MHKSKNRAEPHGVTQVGDSGAEPEAGGALHWGGALPDRLPTWVGVGVDAGRGDGLDLNRGAPEAEEGGAEPNGRVSEAAPIKNSSPPGHRAVRHDSGDAARQAADPLPPWPWPRSPALIVDPSELTGQDRRELRASGPSGLFPHQRFA